LGLRWPRRLTLAALIAAVLLLPSAAAANMANPHQPGDPLGEPYGGLQSVAITHEVLAIDLRPLHDDAPALIDATYSVRNDGAVRDLDLQFVAASLAAGEASVWLDDTLIPSRRATATVPDSWQPPPTTPAIRGGDVLTYTVRKDQSLFFSVSLSAGEHRIRVHYPATAGAYSGGSPTRYWQLGYVLAPAREWAGFGGLDVTVHIPTGWRAASDPMLQRTSDLLSGSFAAIPADALALTTQAPPPVTNLIPFAWIGGLVVSVFLGLLAGRWLGRHGRTSAWALPLSAGVALGWFVAVLITAAAGSPTVPAGQDAWAYHYGQTVGALLASPLALIGGLVFTQTSALLGRRSSR